MQSIGLLFRVLWSPGEAMFLLSKTPRVIVPVIFISLVSLLSAIVVQSKVQYGELVMNMITHSPRGAQMPEDAKAQLHTLMNSPVVKGVFVGSAIVMPFLIILIVALIYFGLFSMLGREGGFRHTSVTAFAFVPMIFSVVASAVRVLVVPPAFLMLDELGSLSPATFLERDSSSPLLFATVNSIDLVSIWILALLVIGYGFLTRKSLSVGTRTAVVLAVFLAYEGLKLGYTAITG